MSPPRSQHGLLQRSQGGSPTCAREFRAAIRDVLPKARIVADNWHVMTRANHMVIQVRRRRSWDLHARRGRIEDPSWKYRTLLTCKQGRGYVNHQNHRARILLPATVKSAA